MVFHNKYFASNKRAIIILIITFMVFLNCKQHNDEMFSNKNSKANNSKTTQNTEGNRGLSIEKTYMLHQSIFGKKIECLINKDLRSRKFDKIEKQRILKSDEIVNILQRYSEKKCDDIDITTFVHDGLLGHSIVINGFYKNGDIIYWDPWGESSFLAEGNNSAGISATKSSDSPRQWLVNLDDFKKVLYVIFMPIEI